jgi:hypothetical protein
MQPENRILRDNEDIEVLRDQILRLEETGFLPRFDYQTCQPVLVAREPRPAA